ncbi:MAG TPA: HEAT repeat domain-containing protein [Deltaproteobacteria bacterium]|nr:HEAT repeat domain-containing protein [Deltaproteobacteria bacterium]
MATIREYLVEMFNKVLAKTITREEGTMLLNDLVKRDKVTTLKEIASLIRTPPPGVFPKTILHTVVLANNKVFNDLLIASLDHRDESVTILAAEGLAKLRTDDAKEVLKGHIDSDIYHVRKASAAALVMGFGKEGVEILKKHVLTHPEPFYRLTSVMAIIGAGAMGKQALLEILATGDVPAIESVAEGLADAPVDFDEEEIPTLIEAMVAAADNEKFEAVERLLGVLGSLGSKAARYEQYLSVFLESPSPAVREAATTAVRRIRYS